MMSLHFWHRHDEVRSKNGAWQPKPLEACVVRTETSRDHLVTVEIDEGKALLFELLLQSSCAKHQFCVALVARALRHGHLACSQTAVAFCCRGDEKRVSIDFGARDVVDQVGLQKNGLACNIQVEQPEDFPQNNAEFFGILGGRQNGDARASGTAVVAVPGEEEW